MNSMIAFVFASCMVSSTMGIFINPLTVTALSTGSLAATAGTGVAATSIIATPAGLALGAAGLLGAAVIKGAIVGSLISRSRRDTEEHVNRLSALDAYFLAIADMDVDDCGKKYVCEIEILEPSQRTTEESMIASLFGEEPLDPASPKAEYDLAAYLGQTTRSKHVCARRYKKCPVDRKTISQAFIKNRQ